MVSPANTNAGVPAAPAEAEGRKSIHGTATCFPPAELEEEPRLLPPVVLLPPAAVLLEEVSVDEVPLEELVPLGLVALPVLPAPAEELNDTTAKSSRPAPGLMITSLIVPTSLPELPVIWAPVSWLARSSGPPMRPAALMCPAVHPDWLLEEPE